MVRRQRIARGVAIGRGSEEHPPPLRRLVGVILLDGDRGEIIELRVEAVAARGIGRRAEDNLERRIISQKYPSPSRRTASRPPHHQTRSFSASPAASSWPALPAGASVSSSTSLGA